MLDHSPVAAALSQCPERRWQEIEKKERKG